MTEAKHTPGPWKIHRGKHNSCYLAIIDSIPDQDGKVVANCICHVAMTNDDRTANANAIAALPDLIAACEMAIKQIESLDDVLNQSGHEVIGWHLNGDTEPIASFFHDNDIGAVERLRAAIAKAKGATK
jgi:hypothetical protein